MSEERGPFVPAVPETELLHELGCDLPGDVVGDLALQGQVGDPPDARQGVEMGPSLRVGGHGMTGELAGSQTQDQEESGGLDVVAGGDL